VTPSDADLIARVLARDDRHAFAELVRRHQSAVRRLLRRLTSGDEALADDLAQETFLRTYRGLRRYQGGARLSTWLYRIAYNVFLDERRRFRPPATARDPGSSPSPAAPALLRHDLDEALRHLPDPERAAVAVVYGADLTHEEAAVVLDCPLGTLKTNIARAKERLRHRLAAWDEAGAARPPLTRRQP
jgi:RNA polymerase sigma-70 factor (ECF subfamily)